MTHLSNSPMEEGTLKPTLGKSMKLEKDRAWSLRHEQKTVRDVPRPQPEPVADEDFLLMSRDISDPDLDSIIDDAANYWESAEDMPRGLESLYPPGSIFCPVLLPFNDNGEGKRELGDEAWQELVQQKGFLRALIVDPDDHLTSGYADVEGYFYDYLPDVVRKSVDEGGCSIKLDYPKEAGSFENRVWFLKKMRRALENLRNILKQRPTVH